MFRKRPLTWLFVIATVAVDWVLLHTENEAVLGLSLKTGFVLGQLAALAIWTVRGRSHRLTRMSCLVTATGLLTTLMCANPASIPAWIAFNTGYVLAIVLATMGTLLFHYVTHKFTHKRSRSATAVKPWQVPLVEFFGWTIVVAMISLGARIMDFGFLNQTPVLIVVALTAVPVALAVFTKRDLRDLRGVKAIVCVVVVIMTAQYVGRIGEEGEWLVLAQAAYLAIWLAVLGMDDVFSYVTSSGHPNALSLLKSGQSTCPNQQADCRPRLFDPQARLFDLQD